MPYTANVPLANQQISASQPIINANFQAILTAFNANHTDLLTSTGLHSFVQFATRAAVPAFAGSPGFWASNAGTSPIMLHTAAGVDINLTDKGFNTATNGYYYLPCGLLVKFGRGTTNTGPGHLLAPIDMDAIGVAYNAIPFVFITGTVDGAGNSIVGCVRTLTSRYLNVNTRTTNGTHVNAPFQWHAISTY